MKPGPQIPRQRTRLAPYVFLAVLAIMLFANHHWLRPRLEPVSAEGHAIQREELPPMLALTTVALGPLRGLVTNILWWRTVEQQDKGNFFEIMQLARWITILQPHFPAVWRYHAWNLSYNVAFEFSDIEDKWKWMESALRLLRDDGLRYNPEHPELKAEIATFFYDRVGSRMDPGNTFYQQQWARTMAAFVPNGNREDLEALAAAPRTRQEAAADPILQPLLTRARQHGLDLLEQHTLEASVTWPEVVRESILQDVALRPAVERLENYHRATKMRRELKLDPQRMLFIDREFGPFDWRLFHAHVVYWQATEDFDTYLGIHLNDRPMVRQAMQRALLDGRLLYDPQAGIFITTNNFEIIGKLHDYYDHMMEKQYSPTVDDLHRRFLQQAAAILYTFNRIDEARKVFDHYTADYTDGGTNFDAFIARSLYETLHNKTFTNQQSLIESALFQAYNWLATGDVNRAVGYANYARLVWTRYQQRFEANPARQLQPFEDIRMAAFRSVMESNIAPEFKERLAEAAVGRATEIDAPPAGALYLGETVHRGVGHTKARQEHREAPDNTEARGNAPSQPRRELEREETPSR